MILGPSCLGRLGFDLFNFDNIHKIRSTFAFLDHDEKSAEGEVGFQVFSVVRRTWYKFNLLFVETAKFIDEVSANQSPQTKNDAR